MNRYYFHIRQDGNLTLDDEGMELRDMAAANEEAASSANDLVRSGLLGAIIEIMDDLGNVLAAVPAFRTAN